MITRQGTENKKQPKVAIPMSSKTNQKKGEERVRAAAVIRLASLRVITLSEVKEETGSGKQDFGNVSNGNRSKMNKSGRECVCRCG